MSICRQTDQIELRGTAKLDSLTMESGYQSVRLRGIYSLPTSRNLYNTHCTSNGSLETSMSTLPSLKVDCGVVFILYGNFFDEGEYPSFRIAYSMIRSNIAFCFSMGIVSVVSLLSSFFLRLRVGIDELSVS